jgi:hypothetical protein
MKLSTTSQVKLDDMISLTNHVSDSNELMSNINQMISSSSIIDEIKVDLLLFSF